MRLSDFLRTDAEQILAAWDEFAATVAHSGISLDQRALRDHAAQILSTIASDLDRPQSDAQQIAKSRGEVERDDTGGETAAETHADTRIEAGFAIDAMITEYRALRASVLRLWSAKRAGSAQSDELQQLTRFNEAIDQAITESVARYTEQVGRAANLFMGVLAHDLRNPLSTILLSAEVLVRSGKLNADAAGPIVNSARRIQGLVELMVDFSRAQSDGVMPVKRAPGNLETLFRSVVEETRVRHPTKLLEFSATGNFAGEWDAARMGQLLSNLLENAISYGERDKAIHIELTAVDASVRLSVHNFGLAIPRQDRERIFEPRSRGSAADERRAPDGLGLGLYICREIVRAHHGTLSLRSESGEGTSFTAVIPR